MSSSGVVVGARTQLAGLAPVSGSVPRKVFCDEYQVLGSTPFRPDLILWFIVNRSHGLAVQILHSAGVGPTSRPAFISCHYKNATHYSYRTTMHHFPPLQRAHTHTHTNKQTNAHRFMQTQFRGTGHGKWSWVSRQCMLVVAGWILCEWVKRPIGH